MTFSIYYPSFLMPASSDINQVVKDLIKLLKDNSYNPISFDIDLWNAHDKNNKPYISQKIYFELEDLNSEEDSINFLKSTKLYKENRRNINAQFEQTMLITNINKQVITTEELIKDLEQISFNKARYDINKKNDMIYVTISEKSCINTLLDEIAKINENSNIEIQSKLVAKDKYKVQNFLESNSTVEEDNFSQKSNQKTVEDFYNEQNYEEINTLLNTFINDVCVYLSKNIINSQKESPEKINKPIQPKNNLEYGKQNENKEDLNAQLKNDYPNTFDIPPIKKTTIFPMELFSDIPETTPKEIGDSSELFDSNRIDNQENSKESN